MANNSLDERLEELYEKRDHIDQFYDADLKTIIDAIRDAREHGGTASVVITPLVGGGGYKITITDSDGVAHDAEVRDGGDAYAVYESTVPEGQTPMSKTEWLASLKGADGADGQDGADGAPGHNPCLGRFSAVPSSFAETPRAGDYYYVDTVTDDTTTPPTVETKIYKYNGTEWDTGTVVDVSNLSFNSGQAVTATKIKDENGEDDPNAQGVLSAEAGQAIVERLSIIPAEEQTINLKADVVWLEGFNYINAGGEVTTDPTGSTYKTSEYIALPQNAKSIIYKGGTATSSNFKQLAVYDANNACLGTFFQIPVGDGKVFDISNLVGATKIRISEWVSHVNNNSWDIAVVTLIAQTNQEVFNNFAQSISDGFEEVDDKFEEVDEQFENLDNNYYLTDPTDVETNLKADVVWLEGFNYINDGGEVTTDPTGSTYKTSEYIALPQNAKSIFYKGGTASTSNFKQLAVYDANNVCLGTFFQTPAAGGVSFDISNLVGATKIRISVYVNYINNNSWDIAAVTFAQKSNKETFNELIDWVDSLNQWKGKRFIAFGASNTAGGYANGTSWIQIASERLKMQPPVNGLNYRRVSLKYVDGALNLVGLAATIAECQSISASTGISYETQFAKDFDCVLFGGFAGESYDESQVEIDGTTYYGGEELIDLVRLPQTRYDNNPHFTYTNGDTLAEHRDSYIGALIFLLNELWTRKPTCRVVFANAFLQWNDYSHWERIRNGVKKLCEKLHLPFISLAESVYFNGFTTGNGIGDELNPDVYLYDGQHASLAGRQRLANIFTHRLLLLS